MNDVSSTHVSRDALEAYVIGALDDADTARVEAHVLGCAACEKKLQHEASLELAFTAVATRASGERTNVRRVHAAPFAAIGAALAMAAAVVLWMVPRGEDSRAPEESAATVSTDVGGDASTFTAQLDVQSDGSSRVGVRD